MGNLTFDKNWKTKLIYMKFILIILENNWKHKQRSLHQIKIKAINMDFYLKFT